jgi:hypothetical protein
VSFKVAGQEIVGRVTRTLEVVPQDDKPKEPLRMGMTIEGNFQVRSDLWPVVRDMLEESDRRHMLANEIRAAECELFASVLRYWTFI